MRPALAVLCLLLFAVAGPQALAGEATIKEAGVTLVLPAPWSARYEESKLPAGPLLQRWVRQPVSAGIVSAAPALNVVVMPLPAGADLAVVTSQVLSREPHRIRFPAETLCIKCVSMRQVVGHGIANVLAPVPAPGCVLPKPGTRADCEYAVRNQAGLKLEPSWVFRYEKEMPWGKLFIVVAHALVDGKLLELTFAYPAEAAEEIEAEVTDMLGSIARPVAPSVPPTPVRSESGG